MATKADIRNRVLQKLGVLAAEETAQSADAELVEGVVDAVHAELEGEGLVSWTVETVPNNIKESFATLVAYRLVSEGSDFGVPADTKQSLMMAGEPAMRRIRRQVSPGWSGAPTEAEYL
jgi:hypothetical protein